MRHLFTLLLITGLCASGTAAQPRCDGAPEDAVLSVPKELSSWMQLECTERGHRLRPTIGYAWEANTSGRQLTFPALGAGGIPANRIQGIPVVVGRSGVYPPLVGGNLMSPHDAYFKWSRLTPMKEELLSAANAEIEGQPGTSGPYEAGYLLDLLSNQTFEYRLYILMRANEPQVIIAMYNVPRQSPLKVVLLVRRS